jgi:hypothetical protein
MTKHQITDKPPLSLNTMLAAVKLFFLKATYPLYFAGLVLYWFITDDKTIK